MPLIIISAQALDSSSAREAFIDAICKHHVIHSEELGLLINSPKVKGDHGTVHACVCG